MGSRPSIDTGRAIAALFGKGQRRARTDHFNAGFSAMIPAWVPRFRPLSISVGNESAMLKPLETRFWQLNGHGFQQFCLCRNVWRKREGIMASGFEAGDAVIWFDAGGASGGMVREVYPYLHSGMFQTGYAELSEASYLVEAVDGLEVMKRQSELSMA
jgi:hypothetical protein